MGNAYAKKHQALPSEWESSGERARPATQTALERLKKGLRSDALAGYLFIAPAIVGFLVFVAYPLIDAAYLSLTNWNGLTDPLFVGFKNFIDLFTKDPSFFPSLHATAYFALLSVPGSLILGLLLALFLNRNLPGVRIFRTLIYLPVILPGIATITLWKFIYDPQVGLANLLLQALHLPTSLWLGSETMSMPSLVIVTLWGVGSTMIIFLAGLQSVPTEVYEAAKMDGAGRFTVLTRVTLPMISPILFLQVILQLTAALQNFNLPKILTGGGPGFSTDVLMLSIYSHGFGNLGTFPQLGYATAQVWVLFLIIVIITIFTFRFSTFWVYSDNKVE
ncbi:MAG TPA: sugar ABC transporter permease [Ktedonobacteraceae bacterium]|nr:sugar ABC transporter permease [Ktedonobacteraceae bacterium]